MLDWIARSRKAIGAVVGSGVLAYIAADQDGTVTADEWGVIAGALVVGIITYVVRNRALPVARPADGAVRRSP